MERGDGDGERAGRSERIRATATRPRGFGFSKGYSINWLDRDLCRGFGPLARVVLSRSYLKKKRIKNCTSRRFLGQLVTFFFSFFFFSPSHGVL